MKSESVPHLKWLHTNMFAHSVVSWTMEQSSRIFSLTIAGFPVLDSAIGNGFLMLLQAFAKLYIFHMLKFCKPTFGNGRNNTKSACIWLYLVRFPTCIGKPDAIFNASGKCHAGIPPDCVRLAEKLALVALRLFPLPPWFHTTESFGAVGREPACVTSKVCQLGDCADRLAHARQASLQPGYLCRYQVRYRCLAVKYVWDWSRI